VVCAQAPHRLHSRACRSDGAEGILGSALPKSPMRANVVVLMNSQ
jgi:hypothetical protein